MMQANEVQQRVSQIKQTIQQASQACDSAGEASIRQYADELEELGDQAKTACENSDNIDQNLKDAVMKAHKELSQLKHQVH